MLILSLLIDRDFYSRRARRKRTMRSSCSTLRILRLIGPRSRPRLERTRIERRKLQSDLFMKRTDTDINYKLLMLQFIQNL